jgi:hypothetical protein
MTNTDSVTGTATRVALSDPAAAAPEEHGYFPGDTGELEYAARCAYVQLMRKTYISSQSDPDHWRAVVEHEDAIRSRMSDLFLELRVDPKREIAMKWQVPAENGDIASLIRPLRYTREQAAVMMIAREALLAARTGSTEDGQMREDAWLDIEDIVALVLTYPAVTDNRGDRAKARAQSAVENARTMGVLLGRPDATRLRVSPVIELLMPVEKLEELVEWFAGGADPAEKAAESNDEDLIEEAAR